MITIRLKMTTQKMNSADWNLLPSFAPLSCASAIFLAALVCVIPALTSTGPTQLHTGNVHEVLNSHELVFINFYADWCRFSQMLHPIFEEASKKVEREVVAPGKVVFGKVDCESESHLSQEYKITKYPTIKLVRFGKTLKREYRGQRSAEAIATYIKEQLKDPIHEHTSIADLAKIDQTKPIIIGYYENKGSKQYQVYQKVASVLRDECEFHSVLGAASAPERENSKKGDHMVLRAVDGAAEIFQGSILNYDEMYKWVMDKCIPLVREITFNNAEELTEEGLPFMILFYHPEHDSDVIKRFHKAVSEQLSHDKNDLNCLTADGTKFTHPLHHLGKAVHDLPILAIDSFRHMYLFNKDVKQHIDSPGALKKFYNDLQSGKLHREFHHGPDPEESKEKKPDSPSSEETDSAPKKDDHVPKTDDPPPNQSKEDKPTDPPESSFAKLLPSRNRYTIIRDEL